MYTKLMCIFNIIKNMNFASSAFSWSFFSSPYIVYTHPIFFSVFRYLRAFFASAALRCGDRLEKRDAIKMKLVPECQRPKQKTAGYTQKIVFMYYQVFWYQHRKRLTLLLTARWWRLKMLFREKGVKARRKSLHCSLRPINNVALSPLVKSFC